MQNLEPFYGWRDFYRAEDDERSPFYNKEYSEFEYTEVIYNHYIHPQWDSIESDTLFAKVIYVDYDEQMAIIELIGEWNDAISNDIELLIVNLLDFLIDQGVNKITLLGTYVLNFHAGEMDYYSDLLDKLESGWIKYLEFSEHVINEMRESGVLNYMSEANIKSINWRIQKPNTILNEINTKPIRLR